MTKLEEETLLDELIESVDEEVERRTEAHQADVSSYLESVSNHVLGIVTPEDYLESVEDALGIISPELDDEEIDEAVKDIEDSLMEW